VKLSEFKQDENLSLCIIGQSGSGKTCLISSFPKPMCILDFDGKVQSAANHLKREKLEAELAQIDVIPIQKMVGIAENKATGQKAQAATSQQFTAIVSWLNEMEAIVKTGKPFPYKTIAFDSITRFSEVLLNEVIRASKGKIKYSVENPFPDQGPETPSVQHYGVNMSNFKSILNRFLALPATKIVTAHWERDKDELTGKIINQALLSGKLSPYLPIVFEEVYRSYVEQTPTGVKYMLQTVSDKDFDCRSQLGLPARIESHYRNLKIS
jgi:ABC-type dipeptide/oligopeptide/nickel transport system ATPase component